MTLSTTKVNMEHPQKYNEKTHDCTKEEMETLDLQDWPDYLTEWTESDSMETSPTALLDFTPSPETPRNPLLRLESRRSSFDSNTLTNTSNELQLPSPRAFRLRSVRSLRTPLLFPLNLSIPIPVPNSYREQSFLNAAG